MEVEITKFNASYIGLRYDLLKFISGENLEILDVGCATGINGKFLRDKKIASVVDGVELDIDMARIAQKYYRNVFVGDMNSTNFLTELESQNNQYDVIICGDVLEHLVHSDSVVSILKDKLKSKGKMIVSLPNVAHWELLIQVYYKGTFPRNERGIFDKTHLSWYTKQDAIALFTRQNMEVFNYIPKYRYRDSSSKKSLIRFGLLKLFFKKLVTFQHILIVQKR